MTTSHPKFCAFSGFALLTFLDHVSSCLKLCRPRDETCLVLFENIRNFRLHLHLRPCQNCCTELVARLFSRSSK